MSAEMQARIKWTDGVQFVAEAGSGHSLVVDGPPDAGGRNTGPRPMELMLMGMGCCSAYDIVQMLKKARRNIIGCTAELRAERADAVPAVFTRIQLHFTVTGRDLGRARVARAVRLSVEKYCSAARMLATGGVEITHEHELVEPD